MRTTKNDLNSPSSSLRWEYSVRGFYETQGNEPIVPDHPWVAGRKCKASLLRIVREENEIYLMKGTVR